VPVDGLSWATCSDTDHELQQLFTNVADVVKDNPLIGWLKQLRGDANTIIVQILNVFAYNEMKVRAGVVGGGLAHVLDPVLADGKRVHLVGHSFGGRLMTAATAAAEGGKISNLTLLEGAFSHNALSVDPDGPINGAFKSVIDNAKVAGRIVAAHSNHDAVLWIAYPLASRVLRDSVSLRLQAGPLGQIFGGPTDRYGAIGANGPQHLPGVSHSIFNGTLLPGLNPGVHALDCTSFVAGHSDVWKPGSAYIVAAGLLSD
jgi:Alpha/beta hydrolase family